ncbi:MAG: GTP-binding protein [Cyanobacteria bacterium P01_F01_bin.13]
MSIEKEWVEPFGDRRQELVFIGTDIDKEEITKRLYDCLISDEELKQDYSKFSDPFPRWH